MPDFDRSFSPNGKEAHMDLESSSYSPITPEFPMTARRYTDGANMDKINWRGDLLPMFSGHGGQDLDVFSASLENDQSSFLLTGSSSYPPGPTYSPTPRLSTSNPASETNDSSIHPKSSKKRQRERRRSSATRCTQCVSPDRPKEGQRVFLQDLPVELLLLIFEFAYLSPIKFPKCEHKQKSTSSIGTGYLARRATANSYFLHNSSAQPIPLSSSPLQIPQSSELSTSSTSHDDAPRLSDSLRIYRAKTLLYIALTCRQFNDMLLDHYIDETFWRSAARWCWDWLPGRLADVQGREITHQTSWRNLVGVFMRSENGLFGQKGGGKGGVESFGGSKGCTPATLWKDERARHMLEKQASQKRKKLLMVCVQPGPDLFHVTHDSESGEYTLSLSLRGEADYFITLDEYGRFGKRPARLPGGLKRTERGLGYFPPNIFEVEGERFQLVKVRKGRDRSTPLSSNINPQVKARHSKPAVKEVVTWNLHCVEEYEADPKASVARCTSKDGWLVFNLFTHRDRDDSNIELLLDPPEDPRLFCVQAFGYPSCQQSQVTSPSSEETMSEKQRGKMRAADSVPFGIGGSEPTTVFRWRREFEYEKASDFQASLHLHYVICNLKLNSTKAVALIRWNVRTASSNEELVDRQFQILDLKTGDTIKVLQFPNLYWDHRHHDMSVEYNEMRHRKMSRLYNHMGPDESMGAGNRCTRIHEDSFFLTDDKIVSGSHDYCNWVWDLNATDAPNYSGCVFNAERNDAGLADPFKVLDDFYWDAEQSEEVTASDDNRGNWSTSNERAGWWVRTPNQVMCFWHGIAGSADGRYFAACRPGKMFVWDLDAKWGKVMGYKNCESGSNDNRNSRWLGRLAAHAEKLKHRLRNWFVWEEVLPEQGLWLLFDDLEAIYLGRDDILNACGFTSGKHTWTFQPDDFTFDHADDGDDANCSGKRTQHEEAADSEGEDYGSEYDESDEEDRPFAKIKRVRTDSSFIDEELVPGEKPFTFETEEDLEFN